MKSSISWCNLALLLFSTAVAAENTNKYIPQTLRSAPFRVGGIQHLQYKYERKTTSSIIDPHVAQVRLPWTTTTALSDFASNLGLLDLMNGFMTETRHHRDNHFSTPDGSQWSLLVHDKSKSTSQHDNNLQYLFANDDATHTQLLSVLAHTEFDSILDSIGTFLNLPSLQIYSMGFLAATHAEPNSESVLKSHLQPQDAIQILIPILIKQGSRPELMVQNTKVQHELDIALVMGPNATYGPGKFDYRDSPNELLVMFVIHATVDTAMKNGIEAHVPVPSLTGLHASEPHWTRDGSHSLLASVTKQYEQQSCSSSDAKSNSETQVCTANDPAKQFAIYNWSNWTFSTFKDYLDCATVNDNQLKAQRPPPDETFWRELQELYLDIVGRDQSTLYDPELNSFWVNVSARHSPGKGRGVFANQFIPEGTRVYTPHQQARFSEGYHYKKMVMSVSNTIACDLLAWMSIQKVVVNGTEQPPQIVVDLDHGALVNSGIRILDSMTQEEIQELQDAKEAANVGCVPDLAINATGGCSENDYALSDIQVGDELLIDYGEYALLDQETWESFGLWDETMDALPEGDSELGDGDEEWDDGWV